MESGVPKDTVGAASEEQLDRALVAVDGDPRVPIVSAAGFLTFSIGLWLFSKARS